MVLSFLLFCDSLLIKSDLIPHVLIHYLTCLKKATCLYFIVYTLNINLIAVDVTEYEYKENGDYMCVCVFEVCIPDCKSFNIIMSEK